MKEPDPPPQGASQDRRHVRFRAAALFAVLLVMIILFSDALERTLAHRLFDAYQALMPRQRISAPAIIVAIDEASLKAHGQWPWPRTIVARLCEAINAAGRLLSASTSSSPNGPLPGPAAGIPSRSRSRHEAQPPAAA